MRFARCRDFPATRQFLLDYVEKVEHAKDKVKLHGAVPVKRAPGDNAETNKLGFCIESEITPEERYRERMRVNEAMAYQQSMAVLREQQKARS